MRRRFLALLASSIALAGAGPGNTAPNRDPYGGWGELKVPRAYVGTWTLGRDGEGADTCRVRLRPQPTIGGFQLTAATACAKVTPRWGDLYAWYVRDGRVIVFTDPTRARVMVLSPLPKGIWATEGGSDKRLLLQKAR